MFNEVAIRNNKKIAYHKDQLGKKEITSKKPKDKPDVKKKITQLK